MTHTIKLVAGDSLEDLATDINNLNAGVTASVVNDGSSNPYRLSLDQQPAGHGRRSGRSTPQGWAPPCRSLKRSNPRMPWSPWATPPIRPPASEASSSSNNFTDLLPGATLQVGQPTDQPVQITVAASDTP